MAMIARAALVALPAWPMGIQLCRRSMATLDWSNVQSLPKQEKVVAFTKSYCPVCRDLMERFDDAGVNLKEVQLDKFDNGNDIRDQLRTATGQEHVPFVYVNGAHMASTVVIPGMKGADAKMKGILQQAGVPVSGYFRA